ncbi:MAG: RNA methyltransferase [Acidobacteriota bacterium]
MEVSDNLTVILVEPWEPGNIGAAARAMRNMGLSRLSLVNPREPYSEACRMMAVGAYPLVESAAVYSTFQEAAAEQQILVGTTSSRGRRPGVPVRAVREVAPELVALAATQRVGLVFGPERRGLGEEILARCRYLVTVPTTPDFPVLNLAQSVLLVAYELFLVQPAPAAHIPDLAPEEDRERLFAHLEQTLLRIGFLSSSNPGHIMRSLRRLFARSDLSPREVKILHGILSQMDWFAESGRYLDPQRVRKP